VIDWEKKVLAPCLDVFGESVTYSPATGSPFSITGVFDNAYRDVAQGEFGTDVISVYPVLGVNLADFAANPVQGDQLTVASNGKTYVVREPRPDSHGGALLILNYLSG
jgi:hypothetical protein